MYLANKIHWIPATVPVISASEGCTTKNSNTFISFFEGVLGGSGGRRNKKTCGWMQLGKIKYSEHLFFNGY